MIRITLSRLVLQVEFEELRMYTHLTRNLRQRSLEYKELLLFKTSMVIKIKIREVLSNISTNK